MGVLLQNGLLQGGLPGLLFPCMLTCFQTLQSISKNQCGSLDVGLLG